MGNAALARSFVFLHLNLSLLISVLLPNFLLIFYWFLKEKGMIFHPNTNQSCVTSQILDFFCLFSKSYIAIVCACFCSYLAAKSHLFLQRGFKLRVLHQRVWELRLMSMTIEKWQPWFGTKQGLFSLCIWFSGLQSGLIVLLRRDAFNLSPYHGE